MPRINHPHTIVCQAEGKFCLVHEHPEWCGLYRIECDNEAEAVHIREQLEREELPLPVRESIFFEQVTFGSTQTFRLRRSIPRRT
jgi:hypothetical protein